MCDINGNVKNEDNPALDDPTSIAAAVVVDQDHNVLVV